jgi:hypothetical protein
LAEVHSFVLLQAEGAVWELLCNVEKGEQQDLHPAIACFAGFLDGRYTSVSEKAQIDAQ